MSKSKDVTDNLPLGDWLAVERTRMANQRTFLAMLRTGLYFLVMGLSVINIEQLGAMRHYYWVFFPIGIAFILIGLFLYLKRNKNITDRYSSHL